MTTQNITLTPVSPGVTEYIQATQGENNARSLTFRVLDAIGQPLDLTGCTVAFYVDRRESGVVQIAAVLTGDNAAQVTLPSGACNIPGEWGCWVQVIKPEVFDLRADNLILRVQPCNIDHAGEASDEFGLLTQLITQAQEAIENANNAAEEAAATAESTATTVATNIINSIALPNLLLNSDFAINQRGQTSYSNRRYTADRWYNSSAETVTITANTLPGSKAKNMLAISQRASQNTVSQPMENLDSVLGQELTASFWAKAQNAGQMRVGIANDVDTVLNVTTQWQRFTVSLNPTARNSSIWTVDGLFFQSAVSSAALGTLYIAEPQLVYGTSAGVYTPPIPAEELVKCQRYYYVSSNNRLYGYTQATNETSKTVYPFFAFSGGFRTVPQVTMPSGGITIRGNGVSTVVQAVNNVYMTETEVSLDVTTAAAIGNSQAISGWFDTANPTIFDAEIYA